MDSQARIDTVLEEIANEKGVLGVSLVSRDGLAVRGAGRLELRRETFSAMTATVLGAAETMARGSDAARLPLAAPVDQTMVLLRKAVDESANAQDSDGGVGARGVP